MKRNITILSIIISIFASFYIVVKDGTPIDIIKNITFIIVICSIQLIKGLINKYYYHISIIQLSLILIGFFFGAVGEEYFLPIVLFELIGEKVNIYLFIGLSLAMNYIFVKEDLFNIALYSVIAILYLYEVRNKYLDNVELKEFSRGQRYERFLMQKKIINLEKYLEQNNRMASLKERNFIAQKLHDHLGHRITSSLMQLEVTKETLDSDKELSKKYLISAMDNLREGMDEIRKVLRNVKPQDTMIGIEEIKEQVLKFQYSSGIKANINIQGDIRRIKINIWMVVEDNIKEALTNAAKYSNATQIDISILIFNRFARIEVRDNGDGCSEIIKGLGIRGMEERINAIGGRIEFNNDNGFIINMIINLGEENGHKSNYM